MGFAVLRKDSSNETPDGVTVKDRLRAWWNGDILVDRPASEGGNSRKSDHDAEMSPVSAAPGESTWTETRRQLAQELWSNGFVVPGGTDYIEKLVSGCSLTAAETMLEIGIGMGGGTRTVIG